MIYFSDFGGVAAAASGVLVYVTTPDAELTVLHFDTEAYDLSGWHDNSIDNELLTVPAGVDYARVILCNRVSDVSSTDARKNGSSFPGSFRTASDTAGAETMSGASAIVAVTAGNTFSFDPTQNLGAGVDSWAAAEVIPSTRKMALVSKSANQAMSAGTTTTMAWGAEIRDTDGFHDNSTDNSRLTVPSGISLVRISACITASGTSTQIVISFQKNGGSAVGLPQVECSGQPVTDIIGAVSAILAVSPGNYFECRAFTTDALSIVTGDKTWFQIEEIPAATKYALVNKSGTQALSAGVFAAVAFGAETADTDGFHDNSTNNSYVTVPSGCTRARLSFSLLGASVTGQLIGEVRKNGSGTPVPGLPRHETDTAGADSVCGFGAWIDVTPGDYFELWAFSTSGQTLPVSDNTWLCIEAE
jgi:hypothetical protein